MKSLLLTILGSVLILSTTARAGDLTGQTAKNLIDALHSAGAYVACGADTCGTETGVMQCTSNPGVHRISCEGLAQDAKGGKSKILPMFLDSKKIYIALVAGGAQAICMNLTCTLQVQSIKCLIQGYATDETTYSCHIKIDPLEK